MRTRPTSDMRRPDEGVALLLALLFVVLLSVIVIEFAYENEVESSFVFAESEQFEAEIAAKSAVSAGLALLAADASMEANQTSISGTNQSNTNRNTTGDQNDPYSGMGQVDSLFDAWALGVPYREINKAAMQCAVSDEYGKINLNALLLTPRTMGGANNPQFDEEGNPLPNTQTDQPKQMGGGGDGMGGAPISGFDQEGDMAYEEQENVVLVETLRALFVLRGVEIDPTDAILDWADMDNDSRSEGAENDFYEATDIPYSCKNAPFDSVEELLLIKGITPEVFFGDPEQGQLPLSELLTVRGDRKGRINLNTAAPEVLEAFGQGMGGQTGLAERVLQERETNPITSMEDARTRGLADSLTGDPANPPQVPPPDPNNPNGQGPVGLDGGMALQQDPFVFTSKVFRIRGLGEAGKSAVRIEAYVYRSSGLGSTIAPRTNSSGASDRPDTKPPAKEPGEGLGLGTEGMGTSTQMFRILDWRVER